MTAAVVDPDRLYVCWEVTDVAIDRAAVALGHGAEGAALVLRVHDTTGRLFDGHNAHHFFDHRVERSDRQWFFTVNRPTSTAVVELGLRGGDGRFVRIARSRRVDFPRKHAAPWRDPEWMTVRAGGAIERGGTGVPSRAAPPVPGGGGAHDEPAAHFAPIPLWVLHDLRETFHIDGDAQGGWEVWETSWQWSTIAGWLDPVWTASWTAGPFDYPVEVGPPFSESWHGRPIAYRVGGVTHVIDGPWQVVVNNLGAFREGTVVSRWEMARSWVVGAAQERRVTGWTLPAKAGASEHRAGASERAWLSGSELRLGGASERFRLGASELRFGGASERLFAGASERRLGGASERRLGGASEVRLAAGSESRLASPYPEW